MIATEINEKIGALNILKRIRKKKKTFKNFLKTALKQFTQKYVLFLILIP